MSGSPPVHFVEVTTRALEGLPDARGDSVRSMLAADHGIEVGDVRVSLGYQVQAEMTPEQIERTVYDLFADPVIEQASCNGVLLEITGIFPSTPEAAIQVGFKPGVTDNAGQAGLDGLLTLYPKLRNAAQVATSRTYMFWDVPEGIELSQLANILHNPMIERCAYADADDCAGGRWPSLPFPARPPAVFAEPAVIDLEVNDEELQEISETGLLALNLNEMHAIQAHYRSPEVREVREGLGLPPNAPTDAELECLAQTWSEHCSHKIFAALINHKDNETGLTKQIDSLFKTHIMSPTLDIQKEVDWLLSVFHDNSGVIAWNDDWSL